MRQSPQIGLFPWYELVKLLAQTAQLWTRRRGMILIDSTRPLLPYVPAGPPSFLRVSSGTPPEQDVTLVLLPREREREQVPGGTTLIHSTG